LHDADLSGAKLGPCEHPILFTHGNRAQCALQVISVDGHIRVVQVHLESVAPLARIRQCRGQRAARQESLALKLLVDPAEETIDQRLGLGQAHRTFGGASELLFANLRFDRV
jgi:hypothetical protein